MSDDKDWLRIAKQTYNFHASKLRDNDKHRLKDTARQLKRSIGAVSQDLLIASWLKSHSSTIEKFDSLKEALEFIRSRKHKLLTDEID